jgi:membrane-associated phospholipid phosphatase
VKWREVAGAITRPYPVSGPMIVLLALVPFYIFIPVLFPPSVRYVPAIALDGRLPLVPVWSLVYGALYAFLILLPVFVVRGEQHIRRTVHAYLLIWITAYVFFVIYPTAAPRPASVTGTGFAVWGLRALYGADPPYNCFPSLHVAHSFVSAWTCHRVHRGLAHCATLVAALVALSTLFTKQHYVLDVVAGVMLAAIAWWVFLRKLPVVENDRVAPAVAMLVAAIVLIGMAGYWVVYVTSTSSSLHNRP